MTFRLGKHVLAVLFFVLLTVGCGGAVIMVNGIEVYERTWQRTIDELLPRTTFDLDCPAQQLSFTLFRKLGREPVEVGVEGCGRRGLYMRPNIGGYISNSWVLSSGTETQR
jgi:hypothetical protein